MNLTRCPFPNGYRPDSTDLAVWRPGLVDDQSTEWLDGKSACDERDHATDDEQAQHRPPPGRGLEVPARMRRQKLVAGHHSGDEVLALVDQVEADREDVQPDRRKQQIEAQFVDIGDVTPHSEADQARQRQRRALEILWKSFSSMN